MPSHMRRGALGVEIASALHLSNPAPPEGCASHPPTPSNPITNAEALAEAVLAPSPHPNQMTTLNNGYLGSRNDEERSEM